jgi:hypothetical protein
MVCCLSVREGQQKHPPGPCVLRSGASCGPAALRVAFLFFLFLLKVFFMAHANDQLRNFTGTTKWFRHFTGYTYTEGVQAMAAQFSAYWFIDLVMSHQTNLKVRAHEFQTWDLKRQV